MYSGGNTTCAVCGETVGPCPGHPTAGISSDRMTGGEGLYWCDECANETALGAVLHICESGDALGLGGHRGFLQDLTPEDIERALRDELEDYE